MWYFWAVRRNVGLSTAALGALMILDIMIVVNIIAAIDLVIAVRTETARVDVGPWCSDLSLPGHRARF